MTCEECDGKGVIHVLYCEMTGWSMSIDSAASRAGDIHHTEQCGRCRGTGEEPECLDCMLWEDCGGSVYCEFFEPK